MEEAFLLGVALLLGCGTGIGLSILVVYRKCNFCGRRKIAVAEHVDGLGHICASCFADQYKSGRWPSRD